MRISAPKDFSGSKRIEQPGMYHFMISAATDEPKWRYGNNKDMFRPGGFEISAIVCDGTAQQEVGKEHHFFFYFPAPDMTASQKEFHLRKNGRLFKSISMMDESVAGRDVDIDLPLAVGRQFVARFTESKGNDGNMYSDLNYADLWHVDDEIVKDVPKSKDHIASIPPELRLIGGRPQQKATAHSEPAPVKTGPAAVDISTL